jgi:hypothetical protein
MPVFADADGLAAQANEALDVELILIGISSMPLVLKTMISPRRGGRKL